MLAQLKPLHERGLLHGDLKPANLVLSTPPRLIDLAGDQRSPIYLAPEVAGTLRQGVGPWTDLYSFGICLFEMITGKPPFQADDLSQLLRLHLNAPPASCGHVRLDGVLGRLLAKSPEARYQTAEAVAHDLEHLPSVVGTTDRRVALAAPDFVGRTRELDFLLQAASAEERQLIVVEAPPGGGKTRLLDQLRSTLEAEGRCCLQGQVTALSAPVPLALFAEVAREAMSRPAVRARLGSLRGVLAEAFPDIVDRDSLLPSTPGDRAVDIATTALAELLEALDGTTVLLFDDVQWADPVSLEALARWARVRGPGVTVVAACRLGELPRFLSQHGDLKLAPLEPADLRTLWASMAGQHWSAPELTKLEELCQGNPFLAVEGLRGLRETGELTSARGSALLQQRLKGLRGLSVLAQAALIGKSFPLDLLVELVGQHEASRALSEARAANILWVGDRKAEFAHDRLREAAVGALEPAARRSIHRRAAEWFASQGDRQAQVYHAHAGGEPEAPKMALEIARRLKDGFALGEALQFYAIALERTGDLEIRLERATVRALVGLHQEARADFDAILAAGRAAWLQARTLFAMGELEYRRNRMLESIRHFEEALKALGLPLTRLGLKALKPFPEVRDEDTARFALRVYLRISDAHGHAGSDVSGFLAAQVWGGKLAERFPLFPEAGVVLANIGTAIALFGSGPRARRYFQRALVATASLPASLERARVLSRVSVDGLQQRDPGDAIAYLEQAISLLESMAEEWELNMARFLLASLYRAQGRLEETRRLARGILLTSARTSVAHHVWQARAFLLQCGDADQPLAGEAPGCAAQCFQTVTRGLSELRKGSPREALSVFLEFRAPRILVDGDHVVLLVWTATAARMCAEDCPFEAGAARAEYYRHARRAARAAIKAARCFRCYLPHALREAALLAQARGHDHRARLLFAESLAEARHFPLEAERTRRALSGRPAAEVYDLVSATEPSSLPTPRLLRGLVDWSRELLTSSTWAQLRQRLEEAGRDLLTGDARVSEDCQIVGQPPDIVAHLNSMARTAGENLREEEERRRASERLDSSREHLRGVLDSAEVALALVDGRGVLLAQNALFARLGQLSESFLERLSSTHEDITEEGSWLSGRSATWCARRSEEGTVVTVTPSNPDRFEALARFQESERELVAGRLLAVSTLLDGDAELQSAFSGMRYDVRADLAVAPDLVSRLRQLARDVAIEIELPPDLPLTELGYLALERILCEGLHNAVRHARPGRILVEVEVVQPWVVARLCDDGQGFNTDGETGRRGVKGMRWRAELVGGLLEVRSLPERGTTLELRLPCRDGGAE